MLVDQSVPPVTVVRDVDRKRSAKAKAYNYKAASKELAKLGPGQFVYSRLGNYRRDEKWKYGEVVKKITPLLYNGLVRRTSPT